MFTRKQPLQLCAPLVAVLLGAASGLMLVLLTTEVSPVPALCLTIGIGVAAAIFYDPRIGFVITAAVVPLERFGRFTDDTSMYTVSLMRMIGVLTLGALSFHLLAKKENFKLGPAFVLYFLYTAFCFFTLFYSTDFEGTVRAFGQIVVNLAFFFLMINVVRAYPLAKLGVVTWLVVTLLITGYTVFDWHFGTATLSDEKIGITSERLHTVWVDNTEWEADLGGIKRAMGSTSHAAVYGINLILTLPFFAFFLRINRKWFVKFAIVLALLLVFYNILLTNTRTVVLVAVFTLMLCLLRKLLVIRFPAVILCVVIAILSLPFLDLGIFERIIDLRNYTYERSSTLRIRLDYWKAGLNVVKENWLFGIGVGNKNEIPKHITGRVPERTTVHNEYLQTFMEVGIFGWIIFFGFVFLLFCYSLKSAKKFRLHEQDSEKYWFVIACQVAMISVLVYGLQCDVFRFPLKGWWIVAGITVMMYELSQRLECKNSSRSAMSNV
jgi:O-antigen ligase